MRKITGKFGTRAAAAVVAGLVLASSPGLAEGMRGGGGRGQFGAPPSENRGSEGRPSGRRSEKLTEVERERKIEDYQAEISERNREKRNIEESIRQVQRDKEKASRERSSAERTLAGFKRSLGREKIDFPDRLSPEEKGKLLSLEKAAETAKDREADLTMELRAEQDRKRALDDEISKREKAVAKLEGDSPDEGGFDRGRNDVDCADGNCPGRGGAGQGSSWTGVAEILKAGTPLAVGLFGAYYGAKSQSRDYQTYMDNCTSVGVPCSAPNGYGGVIGAALGAAMQGYGLMAQSGGFGSGMMWGGYGGGMNGGMMRGMGGFGGYSPYGNMGGSFGFGMGGGIIHVPLLANVLGFPVHLAAGTSHFVLALTSAAAVTEHHLRGHYAGLQGFVPYLLAGILAGAQVGAQFSRIVSSRRILLILALALASVGVRLTAGWLV
ncbi:MAG: hypothetical protein HUU37_00385 [Bdellovibrionales bacterium]|nr:hypothetical protein [Bdellovibrionales bacterium]